MLVIANSAALARALDSPINPALKALLCLRRDQLTADPDLQHPLFLRRSTEAAHFYIIAPDDSVPSIEVAVGFPILTDIDGNPFDHPDFTTSFEWIQRHPGWFEACLLLSDDGPATVLLVSASPSRLLPNPRLRSARSPCSACWGYALPIRGCCWCFSR